MEAIRQSLRELAVDRGRVLLVTMGVAWGALSLSIVLAFGAGFEKAMKKTMVAAGDDLIRFWSGATSKPWRGQASGRIIRLIPEDAIALMKSIPNVRDVSVEYASWGNGIEYKRKRANARVHGVDPIYGALRHFSPQAGGRFLNTIDSTEKRRVAFFGRRISQQLFGEIDPIGKTVTIWGLPFTVVGVLRYQSSISNYEGMDEDKIFIPATTFKSLRNWRGVSYLVVGLRNPEHDRQTLRDIIRALSRRHAFDPNDEMAVLYVNQVELAGQIDSIIGSTRALMVIVAIFGLAIALVGVVNIMYVMVEERCREIGIQMALGARANHIIWDRLVEGTIITLVGGLCGVIGSAMVIQALNLLPIDAEIRDYLGYPILSISVALGISTILGIAGCVAGYWPARKAASLEPIKAINEE
jgi:putative ABC transport system permease protein